MKTNVLSGFIITVLLLAVATAFGNYDPHPKGIDYSENYRGQYHFSPKSEWMNDINALMYQDGKYHMIYQWGKAKAVVVGYRVYDVDYADGSFLYDVKQDGWGIGLVRYF